MTAQTWIDLKAVSFATGETTVAEGRGLAASVFRYASDVAALRIRNAVGEMVALPWQGQQIADAAFHGRRLTMRSLFDEPVAARDYLGNSGGFFIHCGATAMGNPAPQDRHPLHGELPNLPYQSAALILGEDSRGPWMGLTGTARYIVAFTHAYEISPTIKLHAGEGWIEADVSIRNLKRTPMELMYLAHINFLPHDGARIIDTVPDDSTHMRLRQRLPEGLFAATENHKALIGRFAAKPALHREVVAGLAIDPEIVLGLDHRADRDGWAHSLQVLADGAGDFVSHRPAELPHAIRWITRNADCDAMGLCLPGTAEADGYLAEKAKGHLRLLAPQETFRCSLAFGALTPPETEALRQRIGEVMG